MPSCTAHARGGSPCGPSARTPSSPSRSPTRARTRRWCRPPTPTSPAGRACGWSTSSPAPGACSSTRPARRCGSRCSSERIDGPLPERHTSCTARDGQCDHDARACCGRACRPSGVASSPVTTRPHFILYVPDQAAATPFRRAALDRDPALDVPGMTEFALGPDAVLGLMPEADIRSLLGPALPDPAGGRGVPRAEVYLVVDDAEACHRRAVAAGAVELSPMAQRSWGDSAAYSLSPDGHVVAFATRA